MITSYTTCQSVRAVLGVSEPEITDVVLEDPIYEVVLKEDLRTLNTGLRADFLALLPPVTPTDDQERFIELVQTYSAYQVARQLLGALAMFAPKTIKDSRTEVDRVTDPYAHTREAVANSLVYLKGKLLEAYAVIEPTAPAPTVARRTLVVNAGLGLNPVTG